MSTHRSIEALNRGDVIRYPAHLRPEHGRVQSRFRILEVEGRDLIVERVDQPEDGRFVVFARQVEDNGVIVESA